MRQHLNGLFALGAAIAFLQCTAQQNTTEANTAIGIVNLPPPYATPGVNNRSNVIGWPAGKMPVAPVGFTVTKYAGGLANPRWIYQLPNGDVLVSEAETRRNNGNDIIIFHGTKSDGTYEMQKVFLKDLNKPFGMLQLNNWFYVANTDGVYRYPYTPGQMEITGKGEKILTLPAGGYNNHWTRNLLVSEDGSKIYVSVGSGSNNGEHGMDNEVRRAGILEINPDGSGDKIFASGLRNPVGMAWQPVTHELWTAVNERDNLGDDLVPDYITSVKEGGFYGWPYAYFGQHEDPRLKGKRPDLVAKAIVPDVSMDAHTASLGLAFYTKDKFPERYRGGAFVGQHGSWNRSILSGYKVVFVPFMNGKPGKPEDFLTGFIADENNSTVYGRPVCVYVLTNGTLLITDDGSDTIWQVSANK
jgi:glucose/arabinose dehydrogenase